VYSILYDQCSEEVKDKIKAAANFEEIDRQKQVHRLIQVIQRVCMGFEDHRQGVYGMVQAMQKLFLHMQEKEFVSDYIRNFQGLWTTTETFGGSPGVHEELVVQWIESAEWLNANQCTNPTKAHREQAKRESSEAMAACMIVSEASRAKFSSLKADLNNDYLKGVDNYPPTIEGAHNLLENYEPPPNYAPPPPRYPSYAPGLAMAHKNEDSGGADTGAGKDPPDSGGRKKRTGRPAGKKKMNSRGESRCFNCSEEDHWASQCPQL
jgi:hypothetical protein